MHNLKSGILLITIKSAVLLKKKREKKTQVKTFKSLIGRILQLYTLKKIP